MSIQLRFTLSFEDFLNAQRLHAKLGSGLNYSRARIVLAVLGVCLIVFGLLSIGNGAPWGLHLFILCCGVLCVLYPWLRRARLKRRYRRTRVCEETSFDIGNENILIKAENLSSEAKWKAVQLNLEDQNMFLLYIAPAKFFALPKRAFTPEQIAELQLLLKRIGVPTRFER